MSERQRRRDVWGDEPSEVDASAVVEELLSDPETARHWHDHPSVTWIKAVGRFIGRNGRRIGITIAGFAVLLAGVVLLVLPGPGWVLIFAGLAILSTEYVWARVLLTKAKRRGRASQETRCFERSSPRRRTRTPGANSRFPTTTWRDPRRHPDRHLVVDRSHAGQGRNFYPPGAKRRGAARFYASQLPARRGRLHLLLPAEREELGAVDRAHAARSSRSTSRRTRCSRTTRRGRTRSTRTCRSASRPRQRTSGASTATTCPTRWSTRCGNGSDDALMPLHSAGQARGRAVPVPAVVHDREEEQGLHRRGASSGCPTTAWRWSSATRAGWRSATSRRRSGFLEERNLPYVASTCPRGSTRACRRSRPRRRRSRDGSLPRHANTEAWNAKSETASERFRYDYSDAELKEWVPRIEGLSEQARETHVLMNNCYRDFAVRNGAELGGMLDLDLGYDPQD